MDLRISLAWDTDATDCDLHVIEPTGEECFYGRKQTTYGGMLSRDFVRGYGPEEYMIKKAPGGTYHIRAKYFSNSAPALSGGTTILASVFSNYSRENEERKMLTLRLQACKDIVDVGSVELVEEELANLQELIAEAQAELGALEKEISAKQPKIKDLETEVQALEKQLIQKFKEATSGTEKKH
eukprot:TRINITY_DN12331_c0_g1_i1.p1 TRINITY_DN12331_c0_g1~~TRINITY_DN12331_c0_g1_i1.p1  ORF type:complete len:183 (-),score=53.42 TRINITY_DN12331_c0_g1_i1:38-586(-)